MYCGIDLGTTNSLIGSGDKLFTGLVSSSVDVSTKSQSPRDIVGSNIVTSYKVNMTTGKEGKLPIACSSIILKDLAKRASEVVGEEVKDIVVSVPAKFTNTQRQAVWDATEMAGLNMRGLINEPTAAAIYMCNTIKDLVVVFDLGGGTFDVTIIDSRAGNYFVVATDGRLIAGDNFDRALCDLAYTEFGVKIRYRTAELRKQFEYKMRIAKESFQRTGMTQYISMSDYGVSTAFELTESKYITTMKNTFRETILLTKYIVDANIMVGDSPKLIFVGGSTACPYLRSWVEDELRLQSLKHDLVNSIPPDLIVAKGVALYAKMLEQGKADLEVADVTKRLCIEDDKGFAITVIEENTTIPISEAITVYNPIKSSKLEVNLYQGTKIRCADNSYVGTLVYDYGEEKEAGDGYVEINVTVDRSGLISLTGIDILTGVEQSVQLIMR